MPCRQRYKGAPPVDANLKMFDLLGRLATGALWSYSSLAETTEDAARKVLFDELHGGAAAIRLLISNNPTLYSPMKDDQAIEMALAAAQDRRAGAREEPPPS